MPLVLQERPALLSTGESPETEADPRATVVEQMPGGDAQSRYEEARRDLATQLARRGYQFDLLKFNELESRRKVLQTETENLQAERNSRSKMIGRPRPRARTSSR